MPMNREMWLISYFRVWEKSIQIGLNFFGGNHRVLWRPISVNKISKGWNEGNETFSVIFQLCGVHLQFFYCLLTIVARIMRQWKEVRNLLKVPCVMMNIRIIALHVREKSPISLKNGLIRLAVKLMNFSTAVSSSPVVSFFVRRFPSFKVTSACLFPLCFSKRTLTTILYGRRNENVRQCLFRL